MTGEEEGEEGKIGCGRDGTGRRSKALQEVPADLKRGEISAPVYLHFLFVGWLKICLELVIFWLQPLPQKAGDAKSVLFSKNTIGDGGSTAL